MTHHKTRLASDNMKSQDTSRPKGARTVLDLDEVILYVAPPEALSGTLGIAVRTSEGKDYDICVFDDKHSDLVTSLLAQLRAAMDAAADARVARTLAIELRIQSAVALGLPSDLGRRTPPVAEAALTKVLFDLGAAENEHAVRYLALLKTTHDLWVQADQATRLAAKQVELIQRTLAGVVGLVENEDELLGKALRLPRPQLKRMIAEYKGLGTLSQKSASAWTRYVHALAILKEEVMK